MPKANEGELELVLGNKQLLIVFFVVVVLLGIFFAMGYIVGRNSVPGSPPAAAVGPTEAAEPQKSSVVPPAPAKVGVPAELEEASPAAAARPAGAGEEAAAVQTSAPPPSTPPAAKPPAPAEPQAGKVYLQVAATTRVEAEALKEKLEKQGYSVALGPVPGQDLLRVLVGPLANQDELARTRTALQQMGLKPFTRRL